MSPAQGSLRRIWLAELLAEFARPLSHGLVADDDAPFRQHLLHHAQTEREAEIQPNGMADDLGREPVAGVAGAGGCCHPSRLSVPVRPGKPVTRQVDGANHAAFMAAGGRAALHMLSGVPHDGHRLAAYPDRWTSLATEYLRSLPQ